MTITILQIQADASQTAHQLKMDGHVIVLNLQFAPLYAEMGFEFLLKCGMILQMMVLAVN